MAGKGEGEESMEKKDSEDSPPSVSGEDMVNYISIWLIGIPVEVQVKDGSLYYGEVHTAYFKEGHGIFLKNAKKIVNGNRETNIEIGQIVDLLLIHFDEIVQVSAKDFPLPEEGFFDKSPGNGTESLTGDVYVQAYTRTSEVEEEELHSSSSRYVGKNESVESHSNSNNNGNFVINVGKNSGVSAGKTSEEEPEVADVGKKCISSAEDAKQSGQPADSFRGRRIKCMDEGENHDSVEEKVQEIQLSSPSSNGVRNNSPPSPPTTHGTTPDSSSTLTTVSSSEAEASGLSTSNSSASDSRSTSPDTPVPGKKTVGSFSIKESKLNPSAKVFTPSFARLQPASSATLAIVSPEYMFNFPAMTVTGQQLGTEISSYPRHSSAQSKLAMCNNFVGGQNDVGTQYVQPVPGHANMRHQPVRFNSQYHPVYVGSPCVNPLPETVMVGLGRFSQFVYMNPAPQDAIQGMPAISQELPHTLINPYHANLPKFQGHTMQLPMNPTMVAGGNPAVIMPSFSQPGRPFFGGTGYFNCKYQ